ncbi:uncharacterized protein LOC128205247 [Mya arenaria]|uniref:uncharacterized protein LOC128205247 n=1 Tax=Mya arenaria TaxID=6604 RepID=UPI0022E13E00|nr:uncharacterized protein LOC128205247 [Mya arenaria]
MALLISVLVCIIVTCFPTAEASELCKVIKYDTVSYCPDGTYCCPNEEKCCSTRSVNTNKRAGAEPVHYKKVELGNGSTPNFMAFDIRYLLIAGAFMVVIVCCMKENMCSFFSIVSKRSCW